MMYSNNAGEVHREDYGKVDLPKVSIMWSGTCWELNPDREICIPHWQPLDPPKWKVFFSSFSICRKRTLERGNQCTPFSRGIVCFVTRILVMVMMTSFNPFQYEAPSSRLLMITSKREMSSVWSRHTGMNICFRYEEWFSHQQLSWF